MYTLYYRPECPFCQKVLALISEENIDVDLKDVSKKENSDTLMKKGGEETGTISD